MVIGHHDWDIKLQRESSHRNSRSSRCRSRTEFAAAVTALSNIGQLPLADKGHDHITRIDIGQHLLAEDLVVAGVVAKRRE